MKRVLRFGTVGVLNTVVDFAVFNALAVIAGVPPIPANVVSNAAGIVNSFVWNRSWTFSDLAGERSVASSFPRFALASVVGLAINTTALWALMRAFGPWVAAAGEPGTPGHALALNALKVAAAVLSLTWNFLAYRYWAFRPRSTAASPDDQAR